MPGAVALCPAYGRGCYGCFGPMVQPNLEAMVRELRHDGMTERDIVRVFRTFNAASPEYGPVPDLAAQETPGPPAEEEPR
ncbi:Oxidoreductase OS=Streptomyces antimycoticus OX=68175 GN=SANT12839_074980 PE=4 SV=1 [Streptomyces antimycoticus]